MVLSVCSAFRQCSAAILQSVDNYAVLCLDIVWCYLCLKNVEDLPDAGIITNLFVTYSYVYCDILCMVVGRWKKPQELVI